MTLFDSISRKVKGSRIGRSFADSVKRLKSRQLTQKQHKRWGKAVDFAFTVWGNPLLRVLILLVAALLVGGQAMLWAEKGGAYNSLFTAMYWAFVSMTTVGYGDIVPVTPTGRVIAMVIILGGGGSGFGFHGDCFIVVSNGENKREFRLGRG